MTGQHGEGAAVADAWRLEAEKRQRSLDKALGRINAYALALHAIVDMDDTEVRTQARHVARVALSGGGAR